MKTAFQYALASIFSICLAIPALGQISDGPTRGLPAMLGPDSLGYTGLDHNAPECPYLFVEISETGTPLIFSPAGAEPALDEGAAEVALARNFELYGQSVDLVTVSTNGYIGFGGGLDREDGGDFSNDCSLPAIPGNEFALNARVMAFHDDLTGETGPGAAYYQYFASCPRPAASGLDEPCTVVQWHNWSVRGMSEVFDFEMILYHESNEITTQVAPAPGVDGSGGTVGIQDASARSALSYACNTGGAFSGPTAVCFYDPNFPVIDFPSDLTVHLSSPTTSVIPGNTLAYQLEVVNSGAQPVKLARLTFPVPAGITQCEWVCQSGRGSECPFPSGSGPLDLTFDLEPGRSLGFTLLCETVVNLVSSVTGTVQITAPALYPDTNSSDNTATVVHSVCPFPTGYWLAVPNWPEVATLLDMVPLVPQCETRTGAGFADH